MYSTFIQCRKCKSKQSKSSPPGYYKDITIKNGIEYSGIKECECHEKWRLNEENYSAFINAGFNGTYFNSADTYEGTKSAGNILRLKQYIYCFISCNKPVQSSILYFYGKNGTQKTVTAHWIGSELIKKKFDEKYMAFDVRYISMKELIDNLWKRERDEQIAAKIDHLVNRCSLLIIDESFDKEKVHVWESGKQLAYIDDFIRTRINNSLGIIFISNKHPNEIKKEGFSVSLQDLIQRELQKRDSLFTFEDNYQDSISTPPEVLF